VVARGPVLLSGRRGRALPTNPIEGATTSHRTASGSPLGECNSSGFLGLGSARAQYVKALRLEQGLRFCRLDVGQKRLCVRACCTCGQRDRVDDRRVRICPEGAGGLYVRGFCRVGLVDNAGQSLASRNKEQSRPHVCCLSDLVRYVGPNTELLQGCLAVLTGGYRVDVGHRETPVAQDLEEVESGLDIDALRFVFRGDK